MRVGSLGCVEFKVSVGHPRSASWLYSLGRIRVVRMGESGLWVAVGTMDLINQREDVGEERALGKTAFGRQKVLVVLPPECLLCS